MRKVAGLHVSLLIAAALVVTSLAVPAVAVPGRLDRSFSDDGKQTAFVHGATGYAVAIDARGRIVVAGYTLSRRTNITLGRFLANGNPDPDFGGGDGRVFTDLGGTDYAFDLAIQKDGKIVVAGERDLTDHSQFAVVRYGTLGGLDHGFSGDGKAFVDFGTKFQGANAVAIGAAGNILLGGFASNGSTGKWAMARLRPNGALDKGFGGDGKVITNMSSTTEQIQDLTIIQAGMIVAAGYAEASSVPKFAVARYSTGGRLDARFGHRGKNLIDVSTGSDIAFGMARRSDGRLVLVGYAERGGRNDWGLVGLGPKGRLDGTFGNRGRVLTSFGPDYEYAYGVAIQPNGRILVVGRAVRSGSDFCVLRYKVGGGLDKSFGVQGRAFTDFFGQADTARGIALQSNGKIVVAGEAQRGGVRRLALARYLRT